MNDCEKIFLTKSLTGKNRNRIKFRENGAKFCAGFFYEKWRLRKMPSDAANGHPARPAGP